MSLSAYRRQSEMYAREGVDLDRSTLAGWDNMKTWLEATLTRLSPKSDTAAAIRYALSRWKALTRYAEDGHLEIDNNAAERALR